MQEREIKALMQQIVSAVVHVRDLCHTKSVYRRSFSCRITNCAMLCSARWSWITSPTSDPRTCF